LLIVEIASFATNLVLSTFYFSQVISIKGAFHKEGFVMSFLGISVGVIFSLIIPFLPESIPWMDIRIGVIVVIWLSLTKHYAQMSWLGSLAVASIGILFYILVSALVLTLVEGLLVIFGLEPAPFLH